MSATMGSMDRTLKYFTGLLEKPEVFLNTQPSLGSKLKTVTKDVYDVTKTQESIETSGTLPQLIVKDFDEEQVWQELELQNSLCIRGFLSSVSGVLAKNKLSFQPSGKVVKKLRKAEKKVAFEKSADDDDDSSAEEERELEKIKQRLEQDNSDGDSFSGSDNFDFGDSDLEEKLMDEDDDDENDEDDVEIHRRPKKLRYKSVVDDKFFKLCEMEEFLEQEDAREEKRRKQEKGGEDDDDDEEEEEIDMFADIPTSDEEDGGGEIKYEDFFDPPVEESKTGKKDKKKVKFSAEEQESEEEEELEEEDMTSSTTKKKIGIKSSFEKKQEKLKDRIRQLEDASLSEKSWQLTGEITGPARPENSLLEEHLQFDVTTRAAPDVTEETTKTLEDIIRQRIKDKAWDDVERKVKPKEDVYEYRKRITLDQEKSKQSLSDVYEQEFLKQQKQDKEEKEDVDPKHEGIRKSMRTLFIKLDALSNFHYTPKEAQPELRIVSNMPSITMEEVAPVTASDQKLLAPEEIMDKPRRDEKGASERSKEDKKRGHRDKKAEKRKRRKEKERREKMVAKMNPGLGNKYSKEKAMRDLEKMGKQDASVTLIKGDSKKTDLKSSAAFFSRLQDEVTSHVKNRKIEKKPKKSQPSSVKLKL